MALGTLALYYSDGLAVTECVCVCVCVCVGVMVGVRVDSETPPHTLKKLNFPLANP